MTIGDFLFTGGAGTKKAWEKRLGDERRVRENMRATLGPEAVKLYGPDVERHEAVHTRQWGDSYLALGFVVSYSYASLISKRKYGNNWEGNVFEMQAGLYAGGYKTWSN